METPSWPRADGRTAEVEVRDPSGRTLAIVPLSEERMKVGRLFERNDIALQPDPQQLVTREGHFVLEREGGRWLVVDGGSVNGTFLRRDGELLRVTGRTPLRDGDVVCVLGAFSDTGERRFFELGFQTLADSQATRAAPLAQAAADAGQAGPCLSYDLEEGRLLLVLNGERHELRIRPQAHRLIRHMAERNAAVGGAPALCTHDELMQAVWADEPMHTRVELARLVWELRRRLEPFGAEHLVENEPRRGYRLHTCPPR